MQPPAATAAAVVSPHARTPEYRRFRTFLFIAMGLSAVVPVGHAVARYGVRPFFPFSAGARLERRG